MPASKGLLSQVVIKSISATRFVDKYLIEEYCALSQRELNKSKKHTVIFVHGAFESSEFWNIVTSHLPPESDYHLLLPDPLSHGVPSHILPFPISIAAQLVSELIVRRAHNSVANLGCKHTLFTSRQ